MVYRCRDQGWVQAPHVDGRCGQRRQAAGEDRSRVSWEGDAPVLIGLLCGHGEVMGGPCWADTVLFLPPSGLQGDLASESWLDFISTAMLDK